MQSLTRIRESQVYEAQSRETLAVHWLGRNKVLAALTHTGIVSVGCST